MAIHPELQGSLAQCSSCYKQFAINYPRPQPAAKAREPPSNTKQAQRVVKKKKEWWQK